MKPSLTERQKAAALVRIVDDEASVRSALTAFFTMADLHVAAYEDGASFLERADFSVPGCVVLDVRLPGLSGIEVFDEMRRRGLKLPVIFLSAHGDIEMAVEAVQRGAKTFLVKPPKTEQLLEIVEEAAAEDFERRREAQYGRSVLRQWQSLTPAERQVAQLIGKGMTNAAASAVLGVAERTVRGQRASVYSKLEVQNAVEMAEFLHDLREAQSMLDGTASDEKERLP